MKNPFSLVIIKNIYIYYIIIDWLKQYNYVWKVFS